MPAKKITKPGREKIVREMIEVFKKCGVYSNISIVYNNKIMDIGNSDLMAPDYEEYSKPKVTIAQGRKPSDYNGNDNTIVVMYDGGPLYSCMQGEFGWNWKDKLENNLKKVFGPYWLSIEEINHYSFTLTEGFKPDYERVMDELIKED